MKVLLPSKGLYGQRLVNLRMPTLRDIRSIQEGSVERDLRKIEFVQMLCNDIDLKKVTQCDIQYVFTLATFSIMMNVIKYDSKCSHCGHEHKKIPVSIVDQEVIDFEVKDSNYTRIVNGKEYTFRVLSGQDYLDACTYALGQEDYEQGLEDAMAALTLGISYEEIETLKEVALPLYMSTLLYRAGTYHGLRYIAKHTCSNCKKEYTFEYEVGPEILTFSPERMINNYVSVVSYVTFQDYLDMTLNEYNGLVRAINKINAR